ADLRQVAVATDEAHDRADLGRDRGGDVAVGVDEWRDLQLDTDFLTLHGDGGCSSTAGEHRLRGLVRDALSDEDARWLAVERRDARIGDHAPVAVVNDEIERNVERHCLTAPRANREAALAGLLLQVRQ